MPIRNGSRGISVNAHKENAGDSRYGAFVLKKTAQGQLWWPAWDGTDNVIRMLPAKDPDDPQKFLPMLQEDPTGEYDEPSMSPWIKHYHVVRFFGSPSIEMIIGDASQVDQSELKLTNPFWILVRAIELAIKNGQEKPGWTRLVKGIKCPLPAPKHAYFVQGFLFRHKSKDFFSFGGGGRKPEGPKGARADDHIVVFGLPISAGKSLVRLIAEGTEPWEKDPLDLDRGAFLHVFEGGTNPLRRNTRDADAASEYDMMAAGGGGNNQGGRSAEEFKGYDACLTETLDDNPNLKAKIRNPALALAKVQYWDDLIEMRTAEQQLELICKSFLLCQERTLKDTLIDVLQYAFRDRSHMLTDEIRDYFKTTVAPYGNGHQPRATKPAANGSPVNSSGGYQAPEEDLGDFFGGSEPTDVAPAPTPDTVVNPESPAPQVFENSATAVAPAPTQRTSLPGTPLPPPPALSGKMDSVHAATKVAMERANARMANRQNPAS